MIHFTNRTAVITGAANGIGKEVARQMASAGAHVALCDLNTQALGELQNELLSQGFRASSHALDVSDASACTTTLADIASAHQGIDYLVHSAGIYPKIPVRDMSNEQWRKLMAVNLDGTFFVCRAAIPHLTQNSAVVTLASVAGHRGSHSHAHYAASKGALSSFSKSLALELAPRTRVNIVAPGIIATSMTDDLVREKGDALLASTPLKRYGKPAEVAGAIVFLCSDLSSFMTGETLHVNGGLYIV
jgi:3-oxoacyl-[acyl-carrier protein] reductase